MSDFRQVADFPTFDKLPDPPESFQRDTARVPGPKPDMVNRPPHYTAGEIECIDALRAALTPEEFAGFCKGNAIKYLWRSKLKGASVQDLQKSVWYARMAAGDDPRKDKADA